MRQTAVVSLPEVSATSWRLLTMCAWAAVVLISAGMIALGTPVLISQLESLCTATVAKECANLLLDAAMVESLRAHGISLHGFVTLVTFLDLLPPIAAVIVSGLLVWRRRDDPMAVFAAMVLVLFVGTVLQSGVNALATQPGWGLPIAVVQFFGTAGLLFFLNVFPDGHFVPGWTRWVVIGGIIWCAIGQFSPPDWPVNHNASRSGFPLGMLLFLVATFAAQVIRYFQVSTRVQRQQTKWVLFGFGLGLSIILANVLVLQSLAPRPPAPAAAIYVILGGSSFVLGLLLMPVSVGLGVLRYRLFDVDLVISRTLVYAGLSAGIICMYVVVVGYLGALFETGTTLPISLVATGAVALAFQPLRERLQNAVNRLVYGERDDPYAVLSRLGQRLEGSLPPQAVLPTVVQTVAEALKVPYAAIFVLHPEGDIQPLPSAHWI